MIGRVKSTEIFAHFGLNESGVTETYFGGNSEVYRFKSGENGDLALKIYRGLERRNQLSLEHELEAHKVVGECNILPLPKLIDSWEVQPSILYKWIVGETPKPDDSARESILDAVKKTRELYLSKTSHLFATDAIGSGADLLNQLESRQKSISGIDNIPEDLLRILETANVSLRYLLPGDVMFPIDTFSFSDYGIHNMLKSVEGSYFFIDFEYFGKDSTSKLIADLFLHPKGIFKATELLKFLDSFDEPDLSMKTVKYLIPGLALKWMYIITQRNIDWNQRTYMTSSNHFEDPILYAKYLEYVFRESEKGNLQTFHEFKSMRD